MNNIQKSFHINKSQEVIIKTYNTELVTIIV